MRLLKVVVVMPFAALLLASCGGTGVSNSGVVNSRNAASSNAATPGSNASSLAGSLDGKQLYVENCQICHRDTGKGGPVTMQGKKIKPADLTSQHARKHADDDLAKDISEGSPDDGMPGFKDKLKPDEIKSIIGYIRSLQQ